MIPFVSELFELFGESQTNSDHFANLLIDPFNKPDLKDSRSFNQNKIFNILVLISLSDKDSSVIIY